jgi:hypothetical protein
MRPRDANIPLFLWIATAVLAHLIWGGGVTRMSKAFEETLRIKWFAAEVRAQVRGTGEVEVALLDENGKEIDEPEPKPAEDTPDETESDDPEEEQSEKDEDTKKKTKSLPDPKPVEPEPEKKEEKKPLKLELKVEKESEEEKAAKVLPQPNKKKQISVVQDVKDKNQKDNPDAEFAGADSNHVKEQTQARITTTDKHESNPTPGGNHSSAASNPGDSDDSKVAQSEDRPGEANQAPSGKEEPEDSAKVAKVTPPEESTPPKSKGVSEGAEKSKNPSSEAAQKGQKAQAATSEQKAAPETLASEQGSFGVSEKRAEAAAKKARRAKKKRLPPMKGHGGDFLGLGAAGTTKNGISLNLTPKQALAAVGMDRLNREKKLDSERRKSKHRGSWKSMGIERWRASIENYVPSVKPGNQTALNTARVPFAGYLNQVHNRLHPIFADSFLASLDSLPGSHPMNRPDIKTHLEIVLNQEDGKVVRMGVTHTSGVTAFDIAALESVMRAQPFGAPPPEIASPDGRVYFHWEFYRNPDYACSTYFAHPFILKTKPKTAPPSVEPPPWRPLDPKEKPPSETPTQRHGWLGPLENHLSLR